MIRPAKENMSLAVRQEMLCKMERVDPTNALENQTYIYGRLRPGDCPVVVSRGNLKRVRDRISIAGEDVQLHLISLL
jgi:hypothetical protein